LPNVAGFEGVAIGEELSSRLDTTILVENDATSAALGEQIHGHGRQYPSFLLATLGTGVGGGLAIDGKVRRGAFGFAAEVGHVLIDSSADAWPCPCGLQGCMEAYAGTVGLLRRFAELGGRAESPRQVADAAHAGDANALEAFRSMGHALGMGLVQAQKLMDLDALIFSGGISASFDLIEPALRAALRKNAFGPPTAEVPLLVSELGEHAGVIGASELHRL
jgi:glucokinase